MSTLAPFLRRLRVRLQDVSDGKTRAQRRAVAAIKEEQFRLGIIVERACDAPTDIVSNPGGAEPLAFEAEVGDLIKRIDHPEVRIEFQAVDNPNPVGEPDVLGAQIAVSVHNAAVADPLDEESSALVQKAALDTFDSSHQPCWQIEAPIEQEATIAGDVVMPFVQLCDRRQVGTRCMPVEFAERCHQPIELGGFHSILLDCAIERPMLFKAAHDDKPIDDLAQAADRKALRRLDQRHDVEINVRRESPVEAQLSPAHHLAARERGEIKISEPDRFFELKDLVSGQKDPGHVGLAAAYLADRLWVCRWPAEELDLGSKGWPTVFHHRDVVMHDWFALAQIVQKGAIAAKGSDQTTIAHSRGSGAV